MAEKFLFRAERNGGYKFNRETGLAEFLDTKGFANEIAEFKARKESFDMVPLPENPSKIALAAPLAIWHETTQACNLDCQMCGKAQAHENELGVPEITPIYRNLATAGVFEVRITGGEACVKPDAEEIVRTAKGNGLFVSLTSNGVYTEKLREKIVNLPIGLFIISLDGTQEINDSIRGQGTYSSTMRTIRALARDQKNVRVNTVLMQQNKDCIEELVEILKDTGVSALTLTPLRPAGKAVEVFYENKLTPEQYMGVVQKVDELRQKHGDFSIATNYDILSTTTHSSNVPSHWSKMCIAGIEAACISPSGNLRACILYTKDGIAGNLTDHTLHELWHNDALWGIFRDPDRRVIEQCKTCDNYTVKCPGSCLAMTEFSKSPEEIYCFRHLVV